MKEYSTQRSLQKLDFPVQGPFKIISHEMEKVLAVKLTRKTLKYRIVWLNADKDLTWYPASDLKTAPHKLRDFHLANPTRLGPPALLPEWLRLYEQGENNYNYMDNDRPMLNPDRTKFFLANQ
ncbi:hypothetical protein DSL72_003613 [Monilinia vaccinii-corymbosi]|uniref:Chromo domain-containing protein n=1 Tax=Monilinia vaccinii-corymbosi TaxID=61207 RepID=A0A8A3NUG8_9HELO|nr:hypothetical protein DSL72_003613 [Monilinia vaccinii-corymbosi]